MACRKGIGALFGIGLAASLLLPLSAAAKWQSGPLAKVRLEGRYDHNVIEGAGDGSSLVQPMVGWRLRNPVTELEATYGVDVIRYLHDGPGRSGWNHRIQAGQDFRLDRRTELTFQQRAERVYDPTALTRTGVVRAAGESTYGMVEGNLSHRFHPRWTGGIRYRGEVSLLDVEGAIDGAVHAPAAWAVWNWTRRDLVGIQYRYQFFDTFQGVDGGAHEPTLSYARLLGPTTRLELSAGPAIYTQEGETSLLPRGKVEAVHRRPRMTFSAGYERALVGSTGFEGALWSDSVAASAGWRVSRPLVLTAAGGWFRNGRAPDGRAFVDGFATALGVRYAIDRDFGVEAAWRRMVQENLVDGEAIDLSRNVFAIGLTWQLNGGQLPR